MKNKTFPYRKNKDAYQETIRVKKTKPYLNQLRR